MSKEALKLLKAAIDPGIAYPSPPMMRVRIVKAISLLESKPEPTELTKYAREVATESPIQAIGKKLAFKLCDRIDRLTKKNGEQQAEIERLKKSDKEWLDMYVSLIVDFVKKGLISRKELKKIEQALQGDKE